MTRDEACVGARVTRHRLRLPRLHLYQLPGYGHVYGWWQQLIHSRGRCVLTRGQVMDDGSRLWWCKWCGHRAVDRPCRTGDKRLLAAEAPDGS